MALYTYVRYVWYLYVTEQSDHKCTIKIYHRFPNKIASQVYIEKIKAKGPDGTIRDLGTISLKLIG